MKSRSCGQKSKQEELVRIRGYVEEVYYPYAQVMVVNSCPGGSTGKRLLLGWDEFRKKGIVGEGMGFEYKLYREGQEYRSVVVPWERE